jgi:hypothetical protein
MVRLQGVIQLMIKIGALFLLLLPGVTTSPKFHQ